MRSVAMRKKRSGEKATCEKVCCKKAARLKK